MDSQHLSPDAAPRRHIRSNTRPTAITDPAALRPGALEPHAEDDLDSRWQRCLTEFEAHLRRADEVTVREYLGNPEFKFVHDIPRGALEAEVNAILAFLYRHQIRVDFLADVTDEDAYRFLTSELLDQPIEDIHIDGLYTCFVYEHFHPNDRYDATETVKEFFRRLFARRPQHIGLRFSRDGMRDAAGTTRTAAEMETLVRGWISSMALFTTHITHITACLVDGEEAVVRADVRWSGLSAGTFTERSGKGEAIFRLHRSIAGFDIVQFSVPGF